ncbi:MAG TPA: hypothetical protein V6D20_18210 [Candidatus Obscuribacterales bacterium]
MTSIALAIVILVVVVVVMSRSQRRRRGLWRSPRASSTSQSKSLPQTKKQLIRLNGGNRDVALRLVEQLRLRYPDRSEQWYWEKAIFDIERDRRV